VYNMHGYVLTAFSWVERTWLGGRGEGRGARQMMQRHAAARGD
jgi:hypothetical protein